MKKGMIITGGSMDMAFAGSFLKQHTFDVVIAVDAGLEKAKQLHIVPDAVVGDFDTIDPKVLDEFMQIGEITWEIHQPEKDETDTELAMITAVSMGCEDITILGATGGRIDHMLGNIHLLSYCLEQGVSATILDRQNRIYLLNKGKIFQKSETWGKYVSFLPLTESVTGITLTGFQYPLFDKTIQIGRQAGLCISNEIMDERAKISFRDGILICVESCD